ncbi:VOC family protein [Hamadaea tsunoensis]|uniref:VOC family protein n=1 Tax=Hamadaea tsunoensis TaxID=53368 RepID=UPI0004838384|nr:VOC family protein [Hamadaea tsunoensis]
MAYTFQVVQDSAHPHDQADWWAETLGWQVEPSDEDFIRRMVAEGHASEADTTTHGGVLVWREGQAIRHPDGLGTAPRVLFQLVPEGKTVKNRMHLDVRIGDDDRDEVVAKLVARGATRLWEGRQGPHTWVTMADPEGNEFCVA